ncbi:hypothetical protein SAMN04488515_1623 [Cognatiyoonia koreensis]|uniref:Flavoprotein, HI0933 family n=2 Tax=Cognatiyoonia koreensis TaxID=364200 RepID=A0A1I0Q302_9RHOB|nr:hypothetical protein SAMN04488515_1623 [Cognatiyoonia koreensis]
MMCAAHAGPGTLLVDHAKAAGEKIRISGGGRCNFTNLFAGSENFISQNPHFAKSALSRYTQWDFIDLVARHGIPYHEKTLGQLFCDTSAKDIITMLRAEMGDTPLWLQTTVAHIRHDSAVFHATLQKDGRETAVTARNLVLASGGKSIPKMGATGFAYQVASDFGLNIITPRPGLVPLTFGDQFKSIAGTALQGRATANGTSFDEAVLFTHRGLSGPAVLQASSYWNEGDDVTLDLAPTTDLFAALKKARGTAGRKALSTVLADHLPNRLVNYLADGTDLGGNLADWSDQKLADLAQRLHHWHLTPGGSEGYRTAEVTLGGIDTDDLNSRTMEAKAVPGLYVIGEAVDVTGWLGGYNFQWAWSSGWAAGTAIKAKHA